MERQYYMPDRVKKNFLHGEISTVRLMFKHDCYISLKDK